MDAAFDGRAGERCVDHAGGVVAGGEGDAQLDVGRDGHRQLVRAVERGGAHARGELVLGADLEGAHLDVWEEAVVPAGVRRRVGQRCLAADDHHALVEKVEARGARVRHRQLGVVRPLRLCDRQVGGGAAV
eukprot:5220803-Pleurochrysis_carterae.AAC.1